MKPKLIASPSLACEIASKIDKKALPNDILNVIDYIYRNIGFEIRLCDLSKIACLEKTYFLKKFKKVIGVTPINFIRNARIEAAKELLLRSDMNITQIASNVGFKSIHHFSNVFSEYVGMRPTQFKTNHTNCNI